MSAVSLNDRLEAHIGSYLDRMVSPDIEVVYSSSIFQKASECEHGDLSFVTVLSLALWVRSPDPTAPAFTVTGTVPLSMIANGDLDSVDLLLGEVWEKAVFGSVLAGMESDLEQVAGTEDGP